MSNANIRLRVLPALPPVDGRPVELQVTDTFVQWRLEGDPTWTNLIAIADLVGPAGPAVELQSNGVFIQYRVVGTTDWIDIVSVETIRGPQGVQGEQGPPGPPIDLDTENRLVGDGFLRGLTYSNNVTDATNDIDIAPGSARDRDNTVTINISSTLVKRLDAAWAAGTNQGGLDTGSKGNSTWYHIHAIYNPTSGVTDVIFSTSLTSPTMPSGFTKRRWIGAIVTDSGGTIVPFVNYGDKTDWKTDILTVSGAANTSTPTLRSMATPPGTKCEVEYYMQAYSNGGGTPGFVAVRDPDRGAFTATSSNNSWFYTATEYRIVVAKVWTDNLGRIYTGDSNAVDGRILLRTIGWRVDRTQTR